MLSWYFISILTIILPQLVLICAQTCSIGQNGFSKTLITSIIFWCVWLRSRYWRGHNYRDTGPQDTRAKAKDCNEVQHYVWKGEIENRPWLYWVYCYTIMSYTWSTINEVLLKYFSSLQDLKDDIVSDTSGNFRTTLKALVVDRAEYEASCLHRAMKGLGTDESVLIEILATRSNGEISGIKEAYLKSTLTHDYNYYISKQLIM